MCIYYIIYIELLTHSTCFGVGLSHLFSKALLPAQSWICIVLMVFHLQNLQPLQDLCCQCCFWHWETSHGKCTLSHVHFLGTCSVCIGHQACNIIYIYGSLEPLNLCIWGRPAQVVKIAFLFFVQGLQYVELFAGEANVFSEVKSQGYGGVAADIEYAAYFPDLLKGCKTNPFDILSTSGLAYLGSVFMYTWEIVFFYMCLQGRPISVSLVFCVSLYLNIPWFFEQPNSLKPAL